MTTQYYTASSADGFNADAENSLEWLFPNDIDQEGLMAYPGFIADVGALAMGATLLPRKLELALLDIARNRDFCCAKYAVGRVGESSP